MTLHEVLSPILPDLAQLVAAVVGIAALSLARWVRARVQNKLAADALALLATNAATLVRGAADEVRRRKDPNDSGAGAWTEDDSRALKARVVNDLRRMSGGAIDHLRATQGLDAAAVQRLLDQAVEAEVEELRRHGDPPLSSQKVADLFNMVMATEAGQALLARLGRLTLGVPAADAKGSTEPAGSAKEPVPEPPPAAP